jgi:hypothetical protein
MDALITSMRETAGLMRAGGQVASVGSVKKEPVGFFHADVGGGASLEVAGTRAYPARCIICAWSATE